MGHSRDIGTVLRAAVGGREGDPRPGWERIGAQPDTVLELARAARLHRVEGYLLEWIREQGGHADLDRLLEQRRADVVRRHLQAVGSLIHIARVLDAGGIDWLTFKGPVLAEHAHRSPSRRSYNDLDILVPRPQFRAALDAMTRAGAVTLDTNVTHLLDLGAGQLHVVDHLGQNIDLHWGLFYSAGTRAAFRFDERRLLERRRCVDVLGREVPTFGAVDTLLHLSLHGALGGGHRLVWLKDIERTVATSRPDWDEVVEESGRVGAGQAVALMLRRTAVETGLDVPSGLLRRLSPAAGLRALDWAAVRAFAPSRADTRGSPARLLAKATRAEAAATRQVLVERVLALRPSNARLVVRPASRSDGDARVFDPDPAGRPLDDYLDWVSNDPTPVTERSR